MDKVTLSSDWVSDSLTIPMKMVNRCLDEANESQLKIYLYLLKNSGKDISVSQIADYFNYSEQDVNRALQFWNRGSKVVEFAKRPTYSGKKIADFAQIPEVSQLLFLAEQYMGAPLKPDDVSSIVYMYDALKFPADLIEYLMEYCISNNKKSFKYIESVANEWKEEGITTLAQAKRITRKVPAVMGEVMELLGFGKDHVPAEAEIGYVRRWTESYGFSMDLIRIACERTVLNTAKPSIRYANSIIKGWHDAKVTSVSDILRLDEEFKQKKLADVSVRRTSVSKKNTENTKSSGKFHNFSEREIDFSALTDDIMSN